MRARADRDVARHRRDYLGGGNGDRRKSRDLAADACLSAGASGSRCFAGSLRSHSSFRTGGRGLYAAGGELLERLCRDFETRYWDDLSRGRAVLGGERRDDVADYPFPGFGLVAAGGSDGVDWAASSSDSRSAQRERRTRAWQAKAVGEPKGSLEVWPVTSDPRHPHPLTRTFQALA